MQQGLVNNKLKFLRGSDNNLTFFAPSMKQRGTKPRVLETLCFSSLQPQALGWISEFSLSHWTLTLDIRLKVIMASLLLARNCQSYRGFFSKPNMESLSRRGECQHNQALSQQKEVSLSLIYFKCSILDFQVSGSILNLLFCSLYYSVAWAWVIYGLLILRYKTTFCLGFGIL